MPFNVKTPYEVNDANTGVTLSFGAHEDDTRSSWLRVSCSRDGEARSSTLIFGPDGEVRQIVPHTTTEPDEAASDRETLSGEPLHERDSRVSVDNDTAD